MPISAGCGSGSTFGTLSGHPVRGTTKDIMWCRGIRGATTCDANTKEDILEATRELLLKMAAVNNVAPDEVGCITFTTTVDLNAEFPAAAARELGWNDMALLCGHEMNVPGALERCIRVLMMVNTEKRADEIAHVYMRGAINLRPRPTNQGHGAS